MPTVNGPDEITTLTGGADKVFYTDSNGDVKEVSIGTDGQTLVSTGATAPEFDGLTGLKGGVNSVLYTNATGDLTELGLSATAGDVLTSNGAAVAPTWEAAASGGLYATTTSSSSTAITAGDVCVLMSDGTVAEVSTIYADGITMGTNTAGSSTIGYVTQGKSSWCEDNLGNIWVVSGDGIGAAGIYLTALTITASGATTTVTWGTPYQLQSTPAYGATISWDPSTDRIVITWRDGSGWLLAEHATPTGTGASATISASSGAILIDNLWIGNLISHHSYVPAHSGTLVIYTGNSYGYGPASQTLFTDTSGYFTTGTKAAPFYNESSASNFDGYWDATNSIFFIVFGQSNGMTRAMTGTYSGAGSTLTLAIRGGTTNGSVVYANSASLNRQADGVSVQHIKHLDRALVYLNWNTGTSSTDQQIQLWDPNAGGNYVPDFEDRMEQYNLNDPQYLWSQTNPALFNAAQNYQQPIAYDETNDTTYAVYSSNDATGAVNKWIIDRLTVTGTTVDRASSTSFAVTAYEYNSSYNAVQFVQHAAAADSRNAALVVFNGGTNAAAAQGGFLGEAANNDAAWLGIAKNSTSGAGQAIEVYVLGGVSDVHTGLTVGADYYAQSDGSIGTGVTATDKFVGRALTATKLLVENTGAGTG